MCGQLHVQVIDHIFVLTKSDQLAALLKAEDFEHNLEGPENSHEARESPNLTLRLAVNLGTGK